MNRSPRVWVMAAGAVLLVGAGAAGYALRDVLSLHAPVPARPAVRAAQLGPQQERGASAVSPHSQGARAALLYEDVERAVRVGIAEDGRSEILDDPSAFRDLVSGEEARAAVVAAARAAGLEEGVRVRYLQQRLSDQVLADMYVRQQIAARVPLDFPTSVQARAQYEQNLSAFVLDERVHVWQIFLPVPAGVEAAPVAALAAQIAAEIKSGRSKFAEAVMTYSGHAASRVNGGYMGLLAVSNLRPVLKSAILDLEEGEVSEPIRAEEGIHVFKRGARLPAQRVPFEQVELQIRERMKNEAIAAATRAVAVEAKNAFGMPLDAATVEQWRQRLRAGHSVEQP